MVEENCNYEEERTGPCSTIKLLTQAHTHTHKPCFKQLCQYVSLSTHSLAVCSESLFLKRNLAHIGMVQCMSALADKVHKQEVHAHADLHSITSLLHNMATLFNNHTYISSSKLNLVPTGVPLLLHTQISVTQDLLVWHASQSHPFAEGCSCRGAAHVYSHPSSTRTGSKHTV